MSAVRLEPKRVSKPWGRRDLGQGFDAVPPGGEPVGEIWFEAPGGAQPELLVKFLFPGENLSIQVHPDDARAQALGRRHGKDEAWFVVAADPHASIAIGPLEVMTADELRAAALDGSIEGKMRWHAVKKDDSFYSPAGTLHAIGAGLTLVEIQQNSDLTYRLYDYGRPRELHLDEGVAAAEPVPFVPLHRATELSPGRVVLADGPKLVMERWSSAGEAVLRSDGRPIWLVPLAGEGRIDGAPLTMGAVWMVEDDAVLALADGAGLLVAYPGADVMQGIWK